MKALVVAVVLALASPAFANPVVDPDATMEYQRPLMCDDALLLRYDWEGGEKGYWVVFKKPNQPEPLIVIYFEPNTDTPSRFYVLGQEVPREGLPGHPCDVLDETKG